MSSPRLLPDRFAGWFWAAPAFLDEVHPPLRPHDVGAAQDRLGVRLPASYLALLRQQNGGTLRGGWPGTVQRRVLGIGEGAPSITEHDPWWRLPADAAGWRPDGAPLLIPFDGDGHWDMCFDYRLAGPWSDPAVTLVDLEARSAQRVAASFFAFLEGVVDAQAEAFVRLYGGDTLDAVAARLAAVVGAPVEDLGQLAFGHRVLRLAMPGRHEWVWLQENRVPCGFRRVGRRVALTDATTLRLPEDPDATVLLSSTPGAAAGLRGALRREGWAP
jgi:hypothetical protein